MKRVRRKEDWNMRERECWKCEDEECGNWQRGSVGRQTKERKERRHE